MNTSQSTSQQTDRNMPLHNIDDNTIQTLMSTSTVLVSFLFLTNDKNFNTEPSFSFTFFSQAVLELGLDMSRIKQVLRDRLERRHSPFGNVDELLAAVLDAQFNEPVADLTEESWYVE